MWCAWPPGGDPNLRKRPREENVDGRWSRRCEDSFSAHPIREIMSAPLFFHVDFLQVKMVDPYPIKGLGLVLRSIKALIHHTSAITSTWR